MKFKNLSQFQLAKALKTIRIITQDFYRQQLTKTKYNLQIFILLRRKMNFPFKKKQ